MPEQKQMTWATIGQVVALFGIRGELKVRLLTDIPQRFEQLEAVCLTPHYISYKIEHVRPYKGEMVVLKLAGVDDANAAEQLRHQELCIPESQLAHLPAGSYYQHDILGLAVFTLDGRELGKIVDIIETGSNDVYTIREPDGRQTMIPAIKDVVRQIDLHHRAMYIDPLPGLLEMVGRASEEEDDIGSSPPGADNLEGNFLVDG